MKLQGKRGVVLGFGISGKAAAKFLAEQGAFVTAVDQNAETLDSEGIALVQAYEGHFDFLVISPGVPPTHPLIQKAIAERIPVLGETELACRFLSSPAIGVTGTNGKTTVTHLIAHVLNESGVAAKPLGNNGIALSGFLPGNGEVVVLELSSYQLETMTAPVFDVGVILNLSPDHLDRYGTMDAYRSAKFRLHSCVKPGGLFYAHPDLLPDSSYLTDDLGFKAPLNFEQENLCAAYVSVKPFGVTKEQFHAAAASFQKPPHRLEWIGDLEGISYYNDSKGTNTDAVIKAVEALSGTVHLIAGGQGKGESYTPWISRFTGRVATVALIGEAAEVIKSELDGHLDCQNCRTLDQALQHCQKRALPGDTILLSPGCASFDQYRNFEERGEEFRQLVKIN